MNSIQHFAFKRASGTPTDAPSPGVVRLDGSPLDRTEHDAGQGRWYVYQRAPGRRRGAYLGPFDGPDAAVTHLRDLVELELLVFDERRASSLFRIVRRAPVAGKF